MAKLLYNTSMNMTREEQTKTWIIGVSGGGDSMALLHMCIEAGILVVVAHMNYQKRESAKRDMEGVLTYCHAHHIPVEVAMQEEHCEENFQAFARRKRYMFYHELIQKYDGAGVLVAHQLDDHLETYLMQKKRKMVPQYYGLQDHVDIYGCHVVRPLLAYTKQELEEYCREHQVPFWLDESNLSNDYTRNEIRHTRIDVMSREEKERLAEEIARCNQQNEVEKKEIETFLSTWDGSCITLCAHPLAGRILHTWIEQFCAHSISYKEQATLLHSMKQANNWTRKLNSAYDIRKEYGKLTILEHIEGYSYTYDAIQMVHTPYFSIVDHGTTIESITLQEEDFPITIRSYQPGDVIQLRFGKKKINRWFIDRKIPLHERKMWPVVVNAQGNIIFVPKIGCDIAHFSNNPNAFVIK